MRNRVQFLRPEKRGRLSRRHFLTFNAIVCFPPFVDVCLHFNASYRIGNTSMGLFLSPRISVIGYSYKKSGIRITDNTNLQFRYNQ